MGGLVGNKHVEYILSVERVSIYNPLLVFPIYIYIYMRSAIPFRYLTDLVFWSSCGQRKDDFHSVLMEYLRVNGAYWGLATLDLLGKLDTVDTEDVVSWIMKCQHESGLYESVDLLASFLCLPTLKMHLTETKILSSSSFSIVPNLSYLSV